MGPAHLAWCHLRHERLKTTILVASITLLVLVPLGLRVLVDRSAQELSARAEASPLVVGARGSPLELVLRALYFEGSAPPTLPFAEMGRAATDDLVLPIPLHVRFHAQGTPIVGTSLEYLEHRRLAVAEGRLMTRLGECVLGAEVARERGLAPGDHVVSSPENVFDLAGVYPLRMRVAGVLAPSHGPDDRAILVDVKTAWVMEGLFHGHQDLSALDASSAVLERDDDVITANASVVQYTEITPENLASFHVHGDTSAYPISAILAVPADAKAAALFRGRYQDPADPVQVARPRDVVDELLATVFTVEGYVVAAVVFVGSATLATVLLVFLLSIRLRRREFLTMARIGAPPRTVATLISLEIVFILLLSAASAALLVGLVAPHAGDLVRALVFA
jgi:putative ABC transport system permease protein